jgi:hypothetical protein
MTRIRLMGRRRRWAKVDAVILRPCDQDHMLKLGAGRLNPFDAVHKERKIWLTLFY